MSNCIVCNEPGIKLLNVSEHPIFYKTKDSVIYKNQKQQIDFLYCYKCFHCQISKTPSNSIQEFDSLSFPNCIEPRIELDQLCKDQTNNSLKLLVIDYNDNKHICIDDFLDIDEKLICEKIYFYKSFDKVYCIKKLLEKCKKLLSPTGEIIIVTSTANVVRDKKFNCISSEVLSFFCTNSMKTLCEQFDLTIKSITNLDESSIYTIGFKTNEIGSANDVILNLYNDIEQDIYDDKLYIIFNLRGLLLKSKLQKQLLNINLSRFEQNKSNIIIGYGLSQKIINIINFCEFDSNYLDYFLSFEIQNDYYVPGTNILIKNYWDLIRECDNDQQNNDLVNFDKVTIVNFTGSRINDLVYNHLTTLYNTSTIDIIELSI